MILLLGLSALAGAIAVAVYAVIGAGADRSTSTQMISLVGAYGGGPGHAAAVGDRRLRLLSGLTSIGRRIAVALSRPSSLKALQRRLDLAGNPTRWTAERVLAAKGCGLLAGAAGGLLLTLGSSVGAILLVAVGAGAFGFVLPDILLYNTGTKRQQAIQKGLADAIDLLVISVQAGLGFDAALAQVARNTSGPLAGEFSRVLQEMQIGKSRREAFDALGERTTASDVRHFVSAVVQADALGVPISGVLQEQGKEMRTRRRQAAEEMAQKVPVKILFPLMTMILPCLFIVVLGPVALKAMASF